MERRPTRQSAWTSPSIFLIALGLGLNVLGAYLTTQRDDSKEVARDLKDHSTRIAILEAQVQWMRREQDRER